MKKFWPLITLLALIIGTFGTHYIQFADAKQQQPMATFTTVSGSVSHLENVRIQGSLDYSSSSGAFDIRNGEMFPLARSVLINEPSYAFKRLQQQYGSFMRGKAMDMSHFHEDAAGLFYMNSEANNTDATITIHVSSYRDGKEDTFSVTLHDKIGISWTTVQRITRQDDVLYAVVSVMYENGTEALYAVEVELATQSLLQAKLLEQTEVSEDYSYYISMLNDTNSLQEERYFAYRIGSYAYNNEVGVEHNEQTIHIWDTAQNTFTTVPLQEIGVFEEQHFVIHQQLLLALNIENEQVVLNRYDLQQQAWLSPMIVETASTVISSFSVTTSAQYVYIASATEQGQVLSIVDALNGQTSYVGMSKGLDTKRLRLSLYEVSNH